MKKIAFCLLLMSMLLACASKKSVATSKHNLPTNISYSTGFQKFYNDFNSEIQGINSMTDYEPSATIQKEFELERIKGKLFVHGFLQTIPSLFDAYSFEQLDGYLTYLNESLYRYKIPVENLRKMLDIKGIVQVDIPQKR